MREVDELASEEERLKLMELEPGRELELDDGQRDVGLVAARVAHSAATDRAAIREGPAFLCLAQRRYVGNL